MPDEVRISREGHLFIVTINRPAAHNALTPAMHQALADAFDIFAGDPELWVAILTGAGDKAFCAGSDLKIIATEGLILEAPWNGGYGGLVARFDLDKPVIAAVNGAALGGGFEIALACDLIIAAEHTKFGLPEPRVGLAAIAGGLHRLPRQIGLKKAMGLILTGESVGAREGERLGFVNEVCPTGGVLDTARRWAEKIMLGSPMAVRASKEAVGRGLAEPSVKQALARQAAYPSMLNMLQSADFIEGPKAYAAKMPPVWVGK